MEDKSNARKGDEVVEVAVAATFAALLMSVVKQLLHCFFRRLVAPSPLIMFPLVHVIIASIVFSSFYIPPHPAVISSSGYDSKVEDKNRDKERTGVARGSEEGVAGADDEVNAKADAFIAAFRRRLVLDSIASGGCYRRHSFRY